MPFAPIRDLSVYYERVVHGTPLLFVSGSGGDLRMRPNQMASPLARRFDMVSYDQRGLGQTSKPDRPCTMADYADDAAAMLDHLGWARVPVIGVSFGGMVAQELVLRHPGRVSRLVLACTSPGGAGGASYPLHTLEHMTREERARHLVAINDTRRDAAWAVAHPDEHAAFVALAASDPYEAEAGRAMGYHRQLAARAGHDTWDRLAQIACPVMIAAGLHDGIALPETQRRMAARIAGAELRFFEGGHLFMIQDKAAFPAIAAFLNG